MIAAALGASPRPSDVVHYVAFASNDAAGFQLLCDAPWRVVVSTYHARVATAVNSVGRTMILNLTRDLVDCMSCLVSHGRR